MSHQNRDMVALAHQFADELRTTAAERDQNFEFPMQEMMRLKELGFTKLIVPKEFGGYGLPYSEVLEITRILATGNMAVAQMFSTSHTICVMNLLDMAAPALRDLVLKKVGQEGSLLANASSEKGGKDIMSYKTTFTPTDDSKGVIISGEKFFCTGSLSADLLYVIGVMDGQFALALMDANTPGVEIKDDWRAMGQRGTASGTIVFTDVYVAMEMICPQAIALDTPDPTHFFGLINQANFSALALGAAQSGFEISLDYVREHARRWPGSGVERGAEDPYVLQKAGQLSAYMSAAALQLKHVGQLITDALSAREENHPELARIRAETMVEVAKAKVFCGDVALKVSGEFFQMCGARSAMAELNLDRFWRDIRTLSLHDPVDYKAKLIGEYLLLDTQPYPSYVS